MPDNTDGVPSQPAAPEAQTSVERKGGDNVGTNQAVARMMQMHQEAADAKVNAAGNDVPAAETPPTTSPPAEDAAPAASAETVAEPEDQPEGEPETKDVLSKEDHKLDPKLQETINKRIGKEVAKRKALEAQLQELQARLQQQPQPEPPKPEPQIVPLPIGAPPLSNIEDTNGLLALQQQAKEAKRWAEEQLDNEVEEVQLGEKILKKQDLRSIIRNANLTLEDHIPARAQFLSQRQQAQKVAFEQFPYLREPSSPDYVQAQAAYQAMPWLRGLPNSDWIIGVQIEGLKALQAKRAEAEKAKGKPAVKTANPPASQAAIGSNGAGGARVAAGTRSSQEISAIRSGLSRKGGVTANEAIAALTKIEQLRTR